MKESAHRMAQGPPASLVEAHFYAAREAQEAWAQLPPRERMRLVGRIRHEVAERAAELSEIAGGDPVEALASQVLPLADACGFLEKRGAALLATRALGWRGRPAWLAGVSGEVAREPLGVLLIVAPSNYPLFLPGVQVVQGLAAGNAVLLKPAPGGENAAQAIADLARRAGIDPRLVAVLPVDVSAAEAALHLPIAKVFFTGSSEIGLRVLATAAARAIPAVAELSGCDAVFVRADADLDLVRDALVFGLRWNGSATCIAPRRVFVARRLAERLEAELCDALSSLRPHTASAAVQRRLAPLVREAVAAGATALTGGVDDDGALRLPCVLADAHPGMAIMGADFFAPLLCLTVVDSDEEALELAGRCPLALGASVFSRDEAAARALARRVRAGNVTINDLIVPTADPRVPFGGRGKSGYGVTRGPEGLLEMTAPKVIQGRRGKLRAHFEEPREGDAAMFRGWILAAHAEGFQTRCRAFFDFLRAAWRRARPFKK